MSVRSTFGTLLLAGFVVGMACAPAGEQRAGEEAEGEAMEETAGMEETPGMAEAQPDTTAAAMWTYLTEEDYRENWAHWPGKQPMYEGTEPHGMLLATYVNDLALDALTNAAGSMPQGAVIVKENYAPDSTFAAATVMFKAPAGYDPEHNDWFWMKRNADGTVEAQGRAAMCQACHGQSERDYIMTPMPGGGM